MYRSRRLSTGKQLSLFADRSRETVQCPGCGGEIVVFERVSDTEYASAYRGKDGLCWECSFPKKAKAG
jgi:hypothetical protein